MTYLTRLASILIGAAALTGCATAPLTAGDSDNAQTQAVEQSDIFYDGEPDVIFATEFPVASAEEAIGRADHALANGNVDLALYLFVRAYSLDNDNEYALFRIGKIHESRGNTALAMRAFQALLQLNPTHARALQAQGLIYLRSGNHDHALLLLERAVAEDPALWRAQNGIGVIDDLRGNHAAAAVAFDTAIKIRPNDPVLLNNRGYSYYLDGKISAAASDFAKAASLGSELAWRNLGLAMARQKHYDEAVNLMRRTVEPELAYNDVGYIAMLQGDTDVARTFFENAIHIAPRYFEEAQLNLAKVAASGSANGGSENGIRSIRAASE